MSFIRTWLYRLIVPVLILLFLLFYIQLFGYFCCKYVNKRSVFSTYLLNAENCGKGPPTRWKSREKTRGAPVSGTWPRGSAELRRRWRVSDLTERRDHGCWAAADYRRDHPRRQTCHTSTAWRRGSCPRHCTLHGGAQTDRQTDRQLQRCNAKHCGSRTPPGMISFDLSGKHRIRISFSTKTGGIYPHTRCWHAVIYSRANETLYLFTKYNTSLFTISVAKMRKVMQQCEAKQLN